MYTITPHFVLGSYYGYTGINGHTYSGAPYTIDKAGVKIAEPPVGGAGNNGGLSFSTDTFGVGTGPMESGIGGISPCGKSSPGRRATISCNSAVRGFDSPSQCPIHSSRRQLPVLQFAHRLQHGGFRMLRERSPTSSRVAAYSSNFTGINWSAFVQDDWKATPRLTVSAGLRWDPYIPAKDSLGRVACFEPGAAQSLRYPNAPPGLIYGGKNHDPGCPDAGIYADYANYGPRIGFAYQMSDNGNRSLRGGAGYYYEPPNALINQQIVGVPPFAPVIVLTDTSFADPYGSANPHRSAHFRKSSVPAIRGRMRPSPRAPSPFRKFRTRTFACP